MPGIALCANTIEEERNMPNTSTVRNRQARLGRTGVAALALLAIGTSAGVAGSIANVTSSVMLPLPTGSISTVAPSPCAPAGEQVALAGNVHVVTLGRQ